MHIELDAYTGAFYLTNERLVFVGYMMDITRKYLEEMPLGQISEIKGGKTFYIIPNVLEVNSCGGKQLKFIVEGRDSWLTAIKEEMDKLG